MAQAFIFIFNGAVENSGDLLTLHPRPSFLRVHRRQLSRAGRGVPVRGWPGGARQCGVGGPLAALSGFYLGNAHLRTHIYIYNFFFLSVERGRWERDSWTGCLPQGVRALSNHCAAGQAQRVRVWRLFSPARPQAQSPLSPRAADACPGSAVCPQGQVPASLWGAMKKGARHRRTLGGGWGAVRRPQEEAPTPAANLRRFWKPPSASVPGLPTPERPPTANPDGAG